MAIDSTESQAVSDTPRQALAERLRHLLDRVPDAAVQEALRADDIGTLTALASPALWLDTPLSAVDQARLRGVARRRSLLERAGGGLTTEAVAEMLGVSGEAVRKRIRRGRLIAMRSAAGYTVPAIQFE